MNGRIKDISFGLGGEVNLTLSVPVRHLDELKGLREAPLEIKVEKARTRRSLNSNSYAWVLISKIAESMTPPLSKEAVYFEMLKRYGQGTVLSVLTSRLDDVVRELDYAEVIGKSAVDGKEFAHIRMWIGSSKYNTKEMSAFIEGIVEEAKDLGIDTATPEELHRMALAWEAKYGG